MFLRGSVISLTKWSALAAGCIPMSGCLPSGFEPSLSATTQAPHLRHLQQVRFLRLP